MERCARAERVAENSRIRGEARNPVMPEAKRNHAKADRAWAGLRARLKFGQAPQRDGRRTRDEKQSPPNWLPGKVAFWGTPGRYTPKPNSPNPSTSLPP